MAKQDKPAHPKKTAGYGELKPDSFYGIKEEQERHGCKLLSVSVLSVSIFALAYFLQS